MTPNADTGRVIHGTYAGYQWHTHNGELPCDACRAANARYRRERRKNPVIRRRDNLFESARKKALWRLARLYPADFQRFVAEEQARAGLSSNDSGTA